MSQNQVLPVWTAIGWLLAASIAAPARAQESSVEELGPRIDALFEAWDRPDSPGASVAVILDNELLYSAGYGCAQLEYGIPIEAGTVFHVASVSKQITAMCVALLAADGELSLDDQLRDHVWEVPDFGDSLTLDHALHHTSGLRDQWELLMVSGTRLDDVISQGHVLAAVHLQKELNFPPGERHLYCNTGFTLAAEAVSRTSGMKFDEFARARIFEPLGMESTHFHDDHQHIVPGRAYSYGGKSGEYSKRVLSYANAGATSLFTTAPDLVRWLANLDHGQVGGVEVLEMMQERGVLNDGTTIDYALGLVWGKHKGWETLSHGGADAGFRSHVLWIPEAKLGVAVLSNLEGFGPGGKTAAIADLVLEGREPPVAIPKKADESPREPAEDSGDAVPFELAREELDNYVGNYRLEDGFSVEIERSRSRLYVRRQGRGRTQIIPRSRAEFGDKRDELHARFSIGEDGAIGGLTLRVGEDTHEFTRSSGSESVERDLSAHAGRYLCEELGVVYTLEAREGNLYARSLRHGGVELRAGWPDEFSSPLWFFQRLRFDRGEQGEVVGFRLDGSRVLGLRFTKL